jgi:hypothetical protein
VKLEHKRIQMIWGAGPTGTDTNKTADQIAWHNSHIHSKPQPALGIALKIAEKWSGAG